MDKSKINTIDCSCTVPKAERLQYTSPRMNSVLQTSLVTGIPPTPLMFPSSSLISKIGSLRFSLAPTIVTPASICDTRRVFNTGDPDFCEFDNIGGCKPVTRGRIWFPKVNGQPTAGPIVVLCHGVPPGNQCQSTFYKGFERLLKCIAANGMIAISIECLVADNAIGRANRIIAQLQRIKSVIKSKGVILTGNETLALVGHSNGGEAVPFAADAVRTGAVKSQFTSVKTVVQLAPSVPNFKLVNQYAQNQLVIQGGLDGNVLPEGGVDHYEQFFGVTMVEKKAMPGTFQSLVFLHGGSHTGLSDIEYNNSCGALSYEGDPSTKKEIVSMLSYLGQSFVVGAYVSRFLRMTLMGDSEFRPWFTGETIPTFQHFDPAVQKNLDQNLGIRILHAEASSAVVLCSNAACAKSFGLQVLTQINMSTFGQNCRHNRAGFKVTWDRTKESSPSLVFNFAELQFASLKDLFLEFDAAQPPGATTSITIQIGASGPLNNTFVPVVLQPQQPVGDPNHRSMVLSTLRVPLSSFPVTPASFMAVVVNFSKSPSLGTILISFPRISP